MASDAPQSPASETISPITAAFFWPLAVGESEWNLYARNLKFFGEAAKLDYGLQPELATANEVRLDLRTMTLRDYSLTAATGVPTIVDAPYAGHSSMIADFAPGQSLMQTLRANGMGRLFLTDWKPATPDMKDFDCDTYIAELNVCVDDLGGRVNLVGLCQGGWMSAMYAARFPDKVERIVLAGAPIDTDAGDGAVKRMAHELPVSYYEQLVAADGGLVSGRMMLLGWKNLDPEKQYVEKYVDLYKNLDDPAYLERQERFSSWYENPVDLPGRWYLQVIVQLFKENRLAKGEFVALGKRLRLADVRCPAYLLAGAEDAITPAVQVFNAEQYLGTPKDLIVKETAPGGHIGLFMGSNSLAAYWPKIAAWLVASGAPEPEGSGRA